jgi:hypothetical protein
VRRPAAAALLIGAGALSGPARAQPVIDRELDAYRLNVRSETHIRLYERSLLPGPAGAIVRSHRLLPIYEYASLRADDLDLPWRQDSLDVELRAWGNTTLGELEADRRIDGDLQTASVRYRQDLSWVRIGRQHFAGGAARYARFDGAAAGIGSELGLGAEAYGGLLVLPRWSANGYHQLGSAADTLLRNPEAVPEPDRADHWLAGGRISYASDWLDAGLSFHEQHERLGLTRRNLGADASFDGWDPVSFGGSAILDLDATDLADAHVWAEASPLPRLDVSVHYEHAQPALFLSRQSVLSVFSTDRYDELGVLAGYRAGARWRLEGGGFGQAFSDGRHGGRGELSARVSVDRADNTVLRVAYVRVAEPNNGYHSIRDSLRQRLQSDLVATAEAYVYLYDDPILGQSSSLVGAGTLEWWLEPQLSVLGGASLAHSPYALADAQAIVRVVYDFWREGAPR